MINGSDVFRMDLQSGGAMYAWNTSNAEIYHFGSDKQVWFKNDVNTTGGVYSNGIPLTSSSKLKRNIRNIDDNDDIFNKIDFCHYEKNINEDWIPEVGVIADQVKVLDPDNKYGLWISKILDNRETMDYIHYSKIFSLMAYQIQKNNKELNELKQEIMNLKKRN